MINRVRERPAGWVIIDRRAVDDNRLSWAARGLLAYLLARPDDWQVRPTHLAGQSGSLYQVRQLLRELEAAGYAELSRRRRPDGTFGGSQWIIREGGFASDQAEDSAARTSADHRDPEIPTSGHPPTSGTRRLSADSLLPNKETLPNQNNTPSRDAEARDLDPPEEETNADADGAQGSLQVLLTERGIDPETAAQLTADIPPAALRRHIKRYDEAKLDGRVRSVGWLVEALRRNPSAPPDARPLLEPGAAVGYLERRGFSLNATRTLDHYFERVSTDDGVRLRPRREVFAHVD